MKRYAHERCTNPRSYYGTAQQVLDDDTLNASEKELALKTMAAQAELLDRHDQNDPPTVGDHPPTLSAIHAALSELGERHAFPAPGKAHEKAMASVEHVIVAVSGNSNVDMEVCQAAKTVADLTKAHVHFVSVIPRVYEQAGVAALAPVGRTVIDRGAKETDEEGGDASRKRELADLAQRFAFQNAFSVEVRTGMVDAEIIAAADESDASLILVGSGKKTWLDDLLSSNVAQEISRKTSCPVMIIPETDNAHSQQSVGRRP